MVTWSKSITHGAVPGEFSRAGRGVNASSRSLGACVFCKRTADRLDKFNDSCAQRTAISSRRGISWCPFLDGWFSSGVGHINKLELRRARLVLRLVATWYSSGPCTQPGHPSVDRCNEHCQCFGHRSGRNDEFCVVVCCANRSLVS